MCSMQAKQASKPLTFVHDTCILGEKPELLLQQPTHTGVESLTGSEESSELKTNDFVKLNEGNFQSVSRRVY